MWLSDSGQTTTILIATSSATSIHVIGARLTRRTTSDRQAAASTNGATHQTSSGRSSRMMAVSVRTESGTPSSSSGGAQQSRPHGRRNRAGSRVVAASVSGAYSMRQASMRTVSTGRSIPALAFDDAARQPRELGVARAARRRAAPHPRATARSRSPPIARARSRTPARAAGRRRRWSRTSRSRRPSTGSGRRSWRASPGRTPRRPAARRAAGRATRGAGRAPARAASGSLQHDHLIAVRHLACSTWCRTASSSRCRRSRSCSRPAASLMIAPAGGSTTWYATSPLVITRV